MKQLEPYQERLLEEKKELDIKLDKLTNFLKSEMFKKISPIDAILLENQRTIMVEYSAILAQRIALFLV